MKVMIVSDSHTLSKSRLLELLQSQEVDAYIHCGDIFIPYTSMPLSNFYLVKGNNDYGNIPSNRCITLDNKVFFLTHGHRYFVPHGIKDLVRDAKKAGASIVCYGHTHAPIQSVVDNVLVINPGSLLYPRGSYRKTTYCIYDTTTHEVVFYDAATHTAIESL